MAAKGRILFLVMFLAPTFLIGQRIVDRKVEVIADHISLSEALRLIANDGKFKLSYNAAAINGDSLVDIRIQGTVEQAIRRLVGPEMILKESGEHLILLGVSGGRDRYKVRGKLVDAADGTPLRQAYVHEVNGKAVVTTTTSGEFELAVSGTRDRTALLLMRKEYHDTVVYVDRSGAMGRVAMRKRDVLERIEPLCIHERCSVEDLGFAKLLVPQDALDQGAALHLEEERSWQISLVPTVSTNGPIAGAVANRVSLNVLAGYSRGLNGFELGGIVNMESRDVKGLQIAGGANLVGRSTFGVQIAGGVNHTMRSLEGLQISGLGNTVWDTLTGVQITGGINVVKGGLRGTQIAGLADVATQDVDGMQIAGGVNITPMDVHKAQIAGVGNYARNVKGAQIAFGANVARDSVGGGQVGAAANYARDVSGGQFSFGANVASGTVSGGQVGFGLNYAGAAQGGQFSFGLNAVPGNVEAGQVGFGLNYAGSIKGNQFSFGANVVSGNAQGGQVGALNFAGRIKGSQVGFVNLSDSLSGWSLGLLSFSVKGYHRADISSSDVMPVCVQFRTGTKGFHNILGYSPAIEPNGRWGFLYGVGSEPRLGKRLFLSIDLTAEHIVEQSTWVDAVNVLGRFHMGMGCRIIGPLSFIAGPVVNAHFSDWRDPGSGEYLSKVPVNDPDHQSLSGTTWITGWLGWKASLGVHF